MADCLFPAGIANVSGTLSKTTIVTSKGVITKRVVAQVRNGKQKNLRKEIPMPKYSKTAFQLRSVDGNLRALRGRIDDFIFRTRNGKIFAFYKPIRNRLNPDAISVHLREIATLYNLEIVERSKKKGTL